MCWMRQSLYRRHAVPTGVDGVLGWGGPGLGRTVGAMSSLKTALWWSISLPSPLPLNSPE